MKSLTKAAVLLAIAGGAVVLLWVAHAGVPGVETEIGGGGRLPDVEWDPELPDRGHGSVSLDARNPWPEHDRKEWTPVF